VEAGVPSSKSIIPSWSCWKKLFQAKKIYSGHTDDHVIEVGVEVFTLGNINTIRRLVMISGQDIVDIVDTSRSQSDLREISGPDTSVGVLGL
jgi:hypothetical protein